MRAITKNTELPSLIEHRKSSRSDYENYTDKDALREALVEEQHGLCCYCMNRINKAHNVMKIEHWHCQRNYPAEQLLYQNLLGACRGGENRPYTKQHCDTRKRDQDLKWNPADPAHHIETRIYYQRDGSIRSYEEDFDAQLNDVLNLNLPELKNNRKWVLDAIADWWKSENARSHGNVPRTRIQALRNKWATGKSELKPYCQVVVWWLDQRLRRKAK